MYTQGTIESVLEVRRRHTTRGRDRERETEKEGVSKTDVGPNSLSLDSITFNRLAGPMLPGAE